MPRDFNGCPHFRYGSFVLARQRADGSWETVDEDGARSRLADGDMARDALEIASREDTALFAVADPACPPRRFSADWAAGEVHVEDGERPVPAEEFMRHALRTDREGRPLCAARQMPHDQYQACRDAGETAHCLDLGELATALRESGNPSRMAAAGMYDIVTSGLDDGLGYMEIMARVTARTERPVHARFGLAEVLPGQWSEIREFPQYMLGAVRSLFGSYMEELLGDFPLERVSRYQAAPGTPVAAMLDEVAEFVSEDPPFEGGNVIPGYRTSPVARYRGEGFEAIVFSDMAGTYAYAWPSGPAPAPGGPGMG